MESQPQNPEFRVKYMYSFFFRKKGIQRTNILSLCNSKAPSKGKGYFIDVIKH